MLFVVAVDIVYAIAVCNCCLVCLCGGHAALLLVVSFHNRTETQTKAVLFFISFGILECSSTACRAFNYAVDLSTYVKLLARLLAC